MSKYKPLKLQLLNLIFIIVFGIAFYMSISNTETEAVRIILYLSCTGYWSAETGWLFYKEHRDKNKGGKDEKGIKNNSRSN